MAELCFVSPIPCIQRSTTVASTSFAPRFVLAKNRAKASARFVATANAAEASTLSPDTTATANRDAIFLCPNCGNALPPAPSLRLTDLPTACPTCTHPIPHREGYVDLTPAPRTTSTQLPTPLRVANFMLQPPGKLIFQLPWVSYAYERGWRNSFQSAGFPGIDKELDMLLDHVLPADTILDMSCGSGLMSRRLATSGQFRRVVAADFSETMVRETVSRAKADVAVPEFDVVRADVARLPFVTGAFDAVHSGAALHCWPNVQDGLREVLRVLAPGGRFAATTFLRVPYSPLRERILSSKVLKRAAFRYEDSLRDSLPYRPFEVDELVYLFRAAGFVDIETESERAFVIVRCRKSE